MGLSDETWRSLLHDLTGLERRVQESPVLPDVWRRYADAEGRQRLLLTPVREHTPGDLAMALRNTGIDAAVVYNQSTAAATLELDELVCCVLPFSPWWRRHVSSQLAAFGHARDSDLLADLQPPTPVPRTGLDPAFLWIVRLLALVCEGSNARSGRVGRKGLKAVRKLLVRSRKKPKQKELLFQVAQDRLATPAVLQSARTVKADAARRLFELGCGKLTWAVIDSGIDRTHPAFLLRGASEAGGTGPTRRKKKRTAKKAAKKVATMAAGGRPAEPRPEELSSRVTATYDFSRLHDLLELASLPKGRDTPRKRKLRKSLGLGENQARALAPGIAEGRDIDWTLLIDHLQVETRGADLHPHGTHVAGILGGQKVEEDGESADGICPDINLIDIRVLDREGKGHEFEIIAALQFVRYLNAHKEKPVVHGVNLSLSIPHDVRNYACGRTPVCDECERLVGSGVVTVAAAGNLGMESGVGPAATLEGNFRTVAITDPGNAESVLTVGATHRKKPHTYGVSYFSSRGPTGDGRVKPDVVAPGEKIIGPIPERAFTAMDGTSMAAPHVSGAAALLMARHPELIGQPMKVKKILCETATDLGRERYFQGHGLVDVLRALQSV